MPPEGPWEILIVGGGPAGSVTGLEAARRGRRVLIVDRSGFPRGKACGESLNPGAVRQLADLGLLPRILELPHGEVSGWTIEPQRGHRFKGHFRSDARGITVSRLDLDAALLDAAREAGAEVRTGFQVSELVRTDRRVTGVRSRAGEEISARWVIGADGLRSVVARRIGAIRRPPRLRKAALTAHVRAAELEDELGELHLTSWGCVGVVRLEGQIANVVLVVDHDHADELAGGPESSFDRLSRSIPPLAHASRVSEVRATGPFDWDTGTVVAPGAMLVGDASGYYDPFTGQGICRALKGGRLAARILDDLLHFPGSEVELLAEYDRRLRRAFRAGRRLQRAVEQGVSHPWVLAPLSHLFDRHPVLIDRLVALTGDVPKEPLDLRSVERADNRAPTTVANGG